jgi:hypothetical protein
MSYFGKTVYVAILLCIPVSFTGCFGGGSTSLISVSGTITSGSKNIPVEGATVALLGSQTSTQTLVKAPSQPESRQQIETGGFSLSESNAEHMPSKCQEKGIIRSRYQRG